MRLVKRTITSEDHLGIETGPLDQEQISISGMHKDVADGSFRQTLGSGNNYNWFCRLISRNAGNTIKIKK